MDQAEELQQKRLAEMMAMPLVKAIEVVAKALDDKSDDKKQVMKWTMDDFLQGALKDKKVEIMVGYKEANQSKGDGKK